VRLWRIRRCQSEDNGFRLARPAALRRCKFPGNVGELKDIIARAACRDTTSEILPGDPGLTDEEEIRDLARNFADRIEEVHLEETARFRHPIK
jgi:transcriptional regulator with GAF, ATPase, and Fis domain